MSRVQQKTQSSLSEQSPLGFIVIESKIVWKCIPDYSFHCQSSLDPFLRVFNSELRQFSMVSCFCCLPQVLQKNMGLFSFLSQLAHFGNSSQVDSTRKRSKWSEGGSEWPSRRGVNFLQKRISIVVAITYRPTSSFPKPKPWSQGSKWP